MAEIGFGPVCERVTARMLANRTLTVIVRPARCLARNLPATRSARWPSTERISSGDTSRRPNADCAPTEPALPCGCTRRWSSLAASAPTLPPRARPSSDCSAPSGDAANWPMVWMPRSASRCRVTGPTPQISPTGSGSRKARSSAGCTTTRPSGLATCDAILARCFVHAAPTEMGSPISVRTRVRIRSPMISGRAEQVHRSGHVEERFVDRDALDQRGEVAEHCHHLIRQPLVLGEVAVHEHQVGAQLLGPPPRHAALHAEPLRLVRRGQHHAASDRDRAAAQRRIEQLLDRCVERIEVGMQDRRAGGHLTDVSRTSVRSRYGIVLGHPPTTVRSRIPRVARSALSGMIGKMARSRQTGSIADQS